MIVNVAVAVGAVLAFAVTFIVASPARRSEVQRPEHRERALRRDPARATAGDVEHLLNRELPAAVTQAVCRLATEREIPPSTLWVWASNHSATLLALALAAGFDRRELAVTRPADSVLDQESLEICAELDGALVGALVVRTLHPATPAERLHRRHLRRTSPRAA